MLCSCILYFSKKTVSVATAFVHVVHILPEKKHSFRGAEIDDGDGDSLTTQEEEEGGDNEKEEGDVPVLLGACAMVLVVVVGVCLALWKMEALPPLPEWAVPLKPERFPPLETPPA